VTSELGQGHHKRIPPYVIPGKAFVQISSSYVEKSDEKTPPYGIPVYFIIASK
jgi:hypothetical protein